MNAYLLKGHFQMGSDRQSFSKEVVGENEDEAKENLYSILGSKHRVKRPKIWIEDVSLLDTKDIVDPVISFNISKGE